MIHVIGIGPSGDDWLTQEARKVKDAADVLLGSERQLEAMMPYSGRGIVYTGLRDLLDQLNSHKDLNCAVLASGDPSFYGIAKYLMGQLGSDAIKIIPGISSVQYLFAAAKICMNDVYMTSAHGRVLNFDLLTQLSKAAILTDEKNTPATIAKSYLELGLCPQMVIGEHLGYPNEKITQDSAQNIAQMTRSFGMNVIIVYTEEAVL